MTKPTIEEVKNYLLEYRDAYGSALLDYDDIGKIKNYMDADRIIENHRTHIEECVKDASRHIDNFKSKIGLY